MNLKQTAKNFGFRTLRLAGALVLIYISMVFYLALTERQNAYPRAITHKEAQAAIKNTARPLSCSLEDGIVLGGWAVGDPQAPTLLYYPDANEDAAQFLAEVQRIPGIDIVTFNYRGSADNKGTPSTENFEPDARQIAECARQVNGEKPSVLAGRGTGAILASEQFDGNQKLILIDPAMSIADAISEKYRFLYPKFLIRAKEKIPTDRLQAQPSKVFLLKDSQISCDRNHKAERDLYQIHVENRENSTLQNLIKKILQHP